MKTETDPMEKFSFMLGTWNLEYRVPASRFSAEDKGAGEGVFSKILNDRFVTFDYHAKLSSYETAAHAIFSWDEKSQIYRFWWFEASGQFMKATCNFTDDTTVYLNWHDSLLIQSFHLLEDGKLVLQMKHPVSINEYEIILEVFFTPKR